MKLQHLTCTKCLIEWDRPISRGPIPKLCSSCTEQTSTTRLPCIHCGSGVNRGSGPFCLACLRTSEVLYRYGVRFARDYTLGGDVLVNGMCFLHACGQLQPFLDKLESIPEMIAYRSATEHVGAQEMPDQCVLDAYDEAGLALTSAPLWTEDFSFKTKRLAKR